MLIKPVLFENFHFPFEDILIIQFQQFLVGEINTKLFKAVYKEIFKTKYVKNVYR